MIDKKDEIDYKKLYEELQKKYNDLLASVDDIGFQIQTFAKQNRLKPDK